MINALVSILFGTAAALALVVVWLSARSGIAVAFAVFEEQHGFDRLDQCSGAIRREKCSPARPWPASIGRPDPLRRAAA